MKQKELLRSGAGMPKVVTLASRPNTISYEPCLEDRPPLGLYCSPAVVLLDTVEIRHLAESPLR